MIHPTQGDIAVGELSMSGVRRFLSLLSESGISPAQSGSVADWQRLQIPTGKGLLTIFVREAQQPFNGDELLPVQIALPRGNDLYGSSSMSEPDQVLFFGNGVSGKYIVEAIEGLHDGDRTLLNESALRQMSALNGQFLSSVLVMQKSLTPGSLGCYFTLWRQSEGRITWLDLPHMSNVFDAALSCAEIYGVHPTVYRCLSGQFVSFKQTSGNSLI